MFNKISSCCFVVASVAVATALADNPYQPQPYQQEGPANYHFKYEVRDDYSGQDFGQEEARSGYNTDGEYSVLLPDGRKQIVTYRVLDAESGYIADVKYEGEAHEAPYHPAPKPYHPAPKPHYAPAPKPHYAPKPAPYVAHPTRAPYVAPATYAPKPAPYHPAPAPYHPAPVHKPAPYHPAPAYKPAPYNPTPAPYKPTPAPYKPTPAPYKPAPVTYGPTYAPTSPKYHASNAVADTPTYNAALVKKRKMKYPKKLHVAATSAGGGLFYGSVKGKLRKPQRV